MFDLDHLPCVVTNVNARAERHGPDERVLAIDLDVAVRLSFSRLPGFFETPERLRSAMFFSNGLPRSGGAMDIRFDGQITDQAVMLGIDGVVQSFTADKLKKIRLSKPETDFSVLLSFQLQFQPTTLEQSGQLNEALVSECEITITALNQDLFAAAG